MSIDVFAPTYDSAAAALLGANHSAASTYTNLTSYLNGSGAMAGNDSTSRDFADAYDDQAQATVDALVDLVDATGNLSVLTATSIENHRRGDATAVYTAPPLLLDSCLIPVGAGEVDVEAYDVPASEGGDGGDLPALLDLVIDHVQGVFWPSADVSKLRATAQGWRYAVGGLDGVAATCQSAISHLAGQRSPEIPLAITAIRDLKTSATALADACDALSTACGDYADQVEHHRTLIKDILTSLAKEAGFTVGAGVVLTGLTAGLSNLGATAAVAARAASYGARIVAVLSKLKAAVRLGAIAKLGTVGTKVKKVAPVLKRLATRTARGGKRPPRFPRRKPDDLGSGWRATSFGDKAASLEYHYGKHGVGAGVTKEQYARDAVAWARNPAGKGKAIQLKDGTKGTRYRTPGGGPGGIVDVDGNVITFWYK